eukprot:Rmarinus@m.10331
MLLAPLCAAARNHDRSLGFHTFAESISRRVALPYSFFANTCDCGYPVYFMYPLPCDGDALCAKNEWALQGSAPEHHELASGRTIFLFYLFIYLFIFPSVVL